MGDRVWYVDSNYAPINWATAFDAQGVAQIDVYRLTDVPGTNNDMLTRWAPAGRTIDPMVRSIAQARASADPVPAQYTPPAQLPGLEEQLAATDSALAALPVQVASAFGVYVVPPPTGVAATDRAAIQAGIDVVAGWASGGTVQTQLGRYVVDFVHDVVQPNYSCALMLRNGVTLDIPMGSEIFLAAGQVNAPGHNPANGPQAAFIMNEGHFGTGSRDIAVTGSGAIDGNAANQTILVGGINFGSAERAFVKGGAAPLKIKNCRGTQPGPPGETMHVSFYRCAVYGASNLTVFSDDGGETASGIASNQCLFGQFSDCFAYRMKNGVGFTHWDSAYILNTGCHSFLNGGNGFLTEYSQDITFANCVAGGIAPDMDRATAPIPKVMPFNPVAGTAAKLGNGQAAQALGSQAGFKIDNGKNITLLNCVSAWNGTSAVGQCGVKIINVCENIRIIGGAFYGNLRGLDFSNGDGGPAAIARMRATCVSPETILGPNRGVDGSAANSEINAGPANLNHSKGRIAPMNLNAILGTTGSGVSNPVSGTTYSNPWPFDCDVRIAGGTVSNVVVGYGGPVPSAASSVATSTGVVVRVPQGGSIAVTWTVQPTFEWMIA